MTDDYVKIKKRLHIGLIPDGNRRYARKHNLPVWRGHHDGAKKIMSFIDWCLEQPEIKHITVFALSTENLSRSKKEVDELWKVYKKYFKKIKEDRKLKEHEVNVRIVGDGKLWKPDLDEVINDLMLSTKDYSKQFLNVLLAYGSKFEITKAIGELIKKPAKLLDDNLLVKENVDLVIRTGGQHRLSNFLTYQSAYAEIYFEDKLFPEVTKRDFDKWINWYHEQIRKFGE